MSEEEKVFAFPVTDNVNGGEEGMELRDWFAGQFISGNMDGYDEFKFAAQDAYSLADAMLEAMKK